ncbi:MAG TPA: histidine phosphatase family protein [Thermoanaerobaculia bacterium]|nr:histidine phosphatase family protein [Thermoanaerobaculia bacterium]
MKPLAARLILVRHGHVAGNPAGKGRPDSDARMNGWIDTPLSPLGWLQVNALRERMKREPPAVARYSSPLQRAAMTARALAGLPFGPLRLLDELKEIHCGKVDGWLATETRLRYPEVWEANLRQDDDDLRWPGGESYRELRERCVSAVRRIVAEHPGERVLVFTHAGVISQLLGVIHGLRPASWEQFRPGNCGITEIEWMDGAGRLIRFDDRSHLEGLPGAPDAIVSR